MAVVYWRPFSQALEPWVGARELGNMHSEVNGLLETVFGHSPQDSADERARVSADMYATNDELVIRVDLPGMSEKDVQVSITGDLLSLKGQRAEPKNVKHEQYFRAERWAGGVDRVFQLPIPVQADKVRATYRDGVLTVTLPKVEAVKPKEIKIDVL
jgi:HSP20 family protein